GTAPGYREVIPTCQVQMALHTPQQRAEAIKLKVGPLLHSRLSIERIARIEQVGRIDRQILCGSCQATLHRCPACRDVHAGPIVEAACALVPAPLVHRVCDKGSVTKPGIMIGWKVWAGDVGPSRCLTSLDDGKTALNKIVHHGLSFSAFLQKLLLFL